ncbi:methyltransferase domain-containing protein [Aequorivita sp. CIP111184]|uniref:methyltransferase domain-containing protein n=1 Tax=Aequorivita sp. CIP111184 TaxID=2211356 RepID=UPI000DBC29CD|nr:methyltransferase domain-containing protein [Aequorivita sp. CIP111184]SRX56186.1 tRNA (cmo5U34)-methyltransferase [Aequorivita sp. CIP111184]
MITFNNKQRSHQIEIMDDLDFQGEEMKNVLNDLKNVNRWLGGNNITIDGIEKLLNGYSKNSLITILDLGCGDGELLRKCADYGKNNNYNFECIGIDFNENILEFAKKKSFNYPNIKFKKIDVFLEEELLPNCDIAICTLFLHHFSSEKIETLLKIILEKSKKGLIINDLQRSLTAFKLFKFVSQMFLKTKTAQHDGLVSIARGFKKDELENISKKIPNQKSKIQWRWAFRYQWILKKNI